MPTEEEEEEQKDKAPTINNMQTIAIVRFTFMSERSNY